MRRVILAHVSTRVAKVRTALETSGNGSWLFLGQNYLEWLAWEKDLAGSPGLLLAQRLAAAAAALRQPFLDKLAEMGRRYASVAWWASRVSERNTLVSPLFLYCCYAKIGREALTETNGALCIICESWELLEGLAVEANQQGLEVHWAGRPWPGVRTALWLARLIVRPLKFLRRAMLYGIGRLPAWQARPGQPRALLRTWVDEACFGDDYVFRDRYFPGLAAWLETRGFSVATLPVMFSVRRSWRAAWEWMRHSRQQFLNPYQFFRLSDYWFTVREAWRQARMPHEAVRLGDLEVTRLFEAERDRTTFDADALEAILCYCLPHRLAEAGYFVDVLIDPFENMIPEKSLILGFRRYLPATMLVGFQHAALYPFMLCNFITASEAKFAPMPDRIVCNGEFFREVLVREGLPAERAVTGPSLRYGHLWQLAERPLPPRAAPAIVFVPLPLMLPEAVELILKICRALEDLPGIRVYLKPHPMSSLKTLLKAAHLEHLPAHFEFVGGGMGEWLAQAHVAVGMSSSTVYEIVAAGVPLVVVGRETGLELNPLSWYPEWRQVYVAPEDIRAEVARWLDASPEELEAYRRRARQILTASFKQITDDTLQVFIEGLPTREGNLT